MKCQMSILQARGVDRRPELVFHKHSHERTFCGRFDHTSRGRTHLWSMSPPWPDFRELVKPLERIKHSYLLYTNNMFITLFTELIAYTSEVL